MKKNKQMLLVIDELGKALSNSAVDNQEVSLISKTINRILEWTSKNPNPQTVFSHRLQQQLNEMQTQSRDDGEPILFQTIKIHILDQIFKKGAEICPMSEFISQIQCDILLQIIEICQRIIGRFAQPHVNNKRIITVRLHMNLNGLCGHKSIWILNNFSQFNLSVFLMLQRLMDTISLRYLSTKNSIKYHCRDINWQAGYLKVLKLEHFTVVETIFIRFHL